MEAISVSGQEARPRVRLRFSLRAAFLLLTAVVVWFGLLADKTRRQQRAVCAIQPYSELILDYQLDGSAPWSIDEYEDPDHDAEPSAPVWLRKLMGEEWFRTPVGCLSMNQRTIRYVPDLPDLGGNVCVTGISDEDLAYMACAKRLQGLNLTGCSDILTDKGLKHLRGLVSLETLWMNRHSTGVGLAYLRGLPKLREVYLNRGATVEGLREAVLLPALHELWIAGSAGILSNDLRLLQQSPQLRFLHLSGAHYTDEAMKHVARLDNLERLVIKNAPVSDTGIRSLEQLTSLRQIYLINLDISDEALSTLALLKDLKMIRLREVQITERGLAKLAGLSRLEQLVVPGAIDVSQAELAALQALMPNCSIGFH